MFAPAFSLTSFLALSLTSLSLLNACGTRQQSSAKALTEKQKRKPSVTISTTEKADSDLPECDGMSQGVSAYVQSSGRIVQCNGKQWQSANPGGFDGRFLARQPIRYFEWEDTSAKRRWASPQEKLLSADEVANSCEKGWKLPSAEELREAQKNGLVDGLKAHGGRSFGRVWTRDFQNDTRMSLELTDSEKTQGEAESQVKQAGVYCVSFSINS